MFLICVRNDRISLVIIYCREEIKSPYLHGSTYQKNRVILFKNNNNKQITLKVCGFLNNKYCYIYYFIVAVSVA
jgi:hypothetical protein